eukprot:CAMPEP_0202971470 /NCGR_PEP_ID=MMETSP1396-20130829/27743_1 /ASSEMBLY_ACC=CAM_ASM_000872 /TAXON_ID= /ORGANISM="Pseudokeronopsis sp., Strain Brazil" /LENGTH=165 /DNA_ID=CAMNT_0049700903 /DNA_START=164 /DNA_END=661 /DNA_ORIENTATION=+
MKVADTSMAVDKEGVSQFCSLVIFAKKFEDLPLSQRIGDIIRVHRATVGQYNKVKQFTANMFFNSSWAIFSPAPRAAELPQEEEKKGGKAVEMEYQPFSFSGKQFTFKKEEQKTIKALRTWIHLQFSKHQMLSADFISKLKDIPEAGAKKEDGRYKDFDLEVKIV